MSREHAMGQLRHLYAQMRDGLTANGPMVADGLLGPAIAELETIESAEILRLRASLAASESERRALRAVVEEAADDLTTWLDRDVDAFGPTPTRPHPCAPGQVRDRLRSALSQGTGEGTT